MTRSPPHPLTLTPSTSQRLQSADFYDPHQIIIESYRQLTYHNFIQYHLLNIIFYINKFNEFNEFNELKFSINIIIIIFFNFIVTSYIYYF